MWLFFLIWPLQLCAGATVPSLNYEKISLVNPLTTTATLLNDTTLASVIGIIGSARKDILITPGTWTIANNLTVPANMGLYLDPEAQFSINSGRSLTINGPLHADLRTIFSGAGDVRFGAREDAVHPHWYGAACDGTGNDQPALQKAIETAATSTYHVLQLPSATWRMTAALTLRQGLAIIGPGSEGGRILVAGRGVKGLVYTSAVVIEANITLKNFTVDGADTTVGNLIDITGTGGGLSNHFNPSTVSPNVDCLRKGCNEVIDGLRITDLTGAFPMSDGTITRLITTAASWDFTAIANGRCETLTKTVTGAATADYATALIPHSLHTVGITYSTEISAANTIAIKRCNNSGRAAPHPAATSIKFIVMKVKNIQ